MIDPAPDPFCVAIYTTDFTVSSNNSGALESARFAPYSCKIASMLFIVELNSDVLIFLLKSLLFLLYNHIYR